MHRILICSHTGWSTGFGRIARGVARSLASCYDVHVVGLGTGREDTSWLGHAHHQNHDPTRTSALSALAKLLQPDVVILVGQAQLLAWQVIRLRRDHFAGAILPYVPMEGPVHSSLPLTGLRRADSLVAYTETGATELRFALRGVDDMGNRMPPVSVIPHATDQHRSTAPIGRELLRRSLFPALTAPVGGVWLLNANRNDYRKRPELTLEAFASIAAGYPEATLVLHGNLLRPGLDLVVHRDRLGLRHQVLFTREYYPDGLGEDKLLELYACCEIGVNTSMAEGWGLIAFEHALSGAAQILPSHQGLREIWGDAPVWIPTSTVRTLDEVFWGHVPCTQSLSIAMEQLVQQQALQIERSNICREHASDSRFGWEEVGAAWCRLTAQHITK